MSRVSHLHDRARMLSSVRAFFHGRQVLEVDCPLLTRYASVDTHIDLIPAHSKGEIRYLHTSPEYGMKRLLVDGIGDIYQMAHVFRDGECGNKHNPEFTLIEWYRQGFTFEQMIQETVDLIGLFLPELPSKTMTYREAIKKYAGIDPSIASKKDLAEKLNEFEIDWKTAEKDELLNLILGTQVEPYLGKDELLALVYYPASQAALARTRILEGEIVAERFEIYYKGYELANGYHELIDPKEQRERFIENNKARQTLGKNVLPIDVYFLEALEKGLPDCCGVAVGFDRLMMLRHNTDNIADILPFSWNNA